MKKLICPICKEEATFTIISAINKGCLVLVEDEIEREWKGVLEPEEIVCDKCETPVDIDEIEIQ